MSTPENWPAVRNPDWKDNEHPDFQLWKLRNYLTGYRPKMQTIMVREEGKLAEYAFTEGYSLGDEFSRLAYRPTFAMQMASIGLDPMTRGGVYAYIINRRPEFVQKFYGWGVGR